MLSIIERTWLLFSAQLASLSMLTDIEQIAYISQVCTVYSYCLLLYSLLNKDNTMVLYQERIANNATALELASYIQQRHTIVTLASLSQIGKKSRQKPGGLTVVTL